MSAEWVLARYEDLINRHDFDLLVPLISEDAVFWFNDGSFEGIVDIRNAFECTWQKFPLEKYWLDDRRWLASDANAASCIYRFCWKAIVNGKALTGSGRGTTVMRVENGVWKIVHEHLSQFPPAPR